MNLRPLLRPAVRRGSAALLLVAGLFACLPAGAQVAVPPLTGHVVDVTGTLPADQAAALEQRLAAVEAAKGSQLAVLIVPTTAPEGIEAYALRVAEQWKLGRKKVDDGAILVVATADRTVRIEVGYGLEGALNDATSKRIIDEAIVPRLRQNDLGGGVSAGVDAMVKVVDGEPLPAAPKAAAADDAGSSLRQSGPVLLVVALVLGSVLRAVLGRLLGALVAGGAVAGVAWFMAGSVAIAVLAGVVALVATLLGIGVGSFLPGGVFTGGGRGGGGGGGGGFSSGGGGFGGGGASGRW